MDDTALKILRMEKIKRAYYYFFYKIYKFIEYTSEMSGGVFWIDYKASLSIIALKFWFLFSCLIHYKTHINNNFEITKMHIIILGVLIVPLNYLSFSHTDAWRDYNKEFDQLPKTVNRRGSWIVFGITLFIITNFIFSLYLLYKMKNG